MGMSISHIIILAIIAIIVIPPEKLPEVMRNLGRFVNDLRRSTVGIWDDIKKDAALRPEDLEKYRQSIAPPPGTPPAHPVTTEEKKDESKPS